MNEKTVERMANTCNNYYSCALCPYNPEDISRFIGDKWIGGCPNYDRKLVYAMSKGYRKAPDGAVILTKEEYEKLKSLYDCQHGSIMTSSIGDLPLTIGGLRKAVDEISRLINVQTELQVLNAKYYNEAKHLRRELKQARKETAKEILQDLYNYPHEYHEKRIVELAKQFGVETKE